MSHKKERRKSRRVVTTLGATLTGPGAEPIEVETLNLSAGGVYITTPRYLTPFTKVQLAVVLPLFGQEPGGEEPRGEEGEEGEEGAEEGTARKPAESAERTLIQVEGIVVRCAPDEEATERHSVAIAFLHLPPEVRNRIEAYVTWRLERSLIESTGSLETGT